MSRRGPAKATTSIIGIDAATQPKKLGLARGRFDGDALVITEALLGSEAESIPDLLVSWMRDGPTLLAIDAPLGWPAPLGRGLHGHRAGQVLGGDSHDLFRRVTDRFVHARLRKLPLEVGADRIARTAHAALQLLGRLRDQSGSPIPLAWSPVLEGVAAIEVYPAASLLSRSIAANGYKGSEQSAVDARQAILSAVGSAWRLEVEPGLLTAVDDRLDAALCVLAGADFLRGRCVGPTAAQLEAAEVEGWIWFPEPLA